ncbi:hypothetical protein HY640_02500 [Candidatus Woesearchaeota archaeon]|nr:hypothetical protein [Candidatus Woesearchaeota archaeon]
MRPLKRKAQTRMLETIAVIIAFFVLVAFGFIVYTNIQKSSMKTKAAELREERAARIAKAAMSLPELQCSRTQTVENCFDKLKIQAFRNYLSGNPRAANTQYYDILKDSTIKIEQVYPVSTDTQTIYERPKGSSKQSIWMPIALYDPARDSTSFGILTVDVYD